MKNQTFAEIKTQLDSILESINIECPADNRDPVYLFAKMAKINTSDNALVALMDNPTEKNFLGIRSEMDAAILNDGEQGFSFHGKHRFSALQGWMMTHVDSISILEELNNGTL